MIGIIAAMQEETVYLKQHMTAVESLSVGEYTFFTGNINKTKVVLLQSGIGKVNAAIGTTLMIERFKPKYIINTGVAGGLHESLAVGDIVISIAVQHHDVDLTVWGYAHGQLPKLPAQFTPCQNLIAAADRAAIKMSMQVTKGLIVSGDSFIHQEADIEKIRQKFPEVHAVEMEGAAIAQVCHQFKVPFVIIRALSDIAGKESPVSFDKFLEQAARNSAEFLILTLESMTAI
ncbi:MAG: 5'-methylthioadenosine/S-adenosylhomocysteine nucleosidase [Gammaproteobacteria bacterium]|jgi:adenosylhomocysteine nucleosidase